MNAGKFRPQQHILGERATKYLQNNVFPDEWVVREVHPDYGIDFDVELFDYEDNRCVTLGEHLFVQVKGTENPNYGRFKLLDDEFEVLKFQLEVDELYLAERMGAAFPLIMIVVDLQKNIAYHICLTDYIKKVLPIQCPNYDLQKRVTIYIPTDNIVSKEDISALNWYAMRNKIYSMFNEMISDVEDFKYMDAEELMNAGRIFIKQYKKYDVLNNVSYWAGLEDIRDIINELSENDGLCKDAIKFVQKTLGYADNWESGIVYESFSEEGMNAVLYAKKFSLLNVLYPKIINWSGMFETYCREWYMPIRR